MLHIIFCACLVLCLGIFAVIHAVLHLYFFVVCLYYMNKTLGTEDPELSQKGKNPTFHMKCLYFFKLLICFLYC
jgi:hypothetical protein